MAAAARQKGVSWSGNDRILHAVFQLVLLLVARGWFAADRNGNGKQQQCTLLVDSCHSQHRPLALSPSALLALALIVQHTATSQPPHHHHLHEEDGILVLINGSDNEGTVVRVCDCMYVGEQGKMESLMLCSLLRTHNKPSLPFGFFVKFSQMHALEFIQFIAQLPKLCKL